MRKMQGAFCQYVFHTFWFGGKIFDYSSSCQVNCCVPAIPAEGAACHLDVGTEAEGNDRYFKSHITSFNLAQVFSSYLQAVLWPPWHYSGFTPVFSRQELTCFTILLFSTKKSEKAWRVDSQIGPWHSLGIPVMGEVWLCLSQKEVLVIWPLYPPSGFRMYSPGFPVQL